MADTPAAAEIVPPPPEEALDLRALEPYLRAHLLDVDGPLEVWRFAGGHANLTYLLRFGAAELVLRRPPLGPVPAGAHDMRREHAVLSRLYEAYPLAPRSFLLCEDEAVIGAVFMVMERRRGITIRTAMPDRFAGRPDLNRRVGEMVIDALAALHQVAPEAVGLQDLGRPDGFVARQFESWTKRWNAALDRPRPETVRLLGWLAARLPASRHATLLHNDYKMDNLVLDAEDPAVPVAVLDWDMCTRGDPLLDLGYVLNYWAEPADDPEWITAAAMPTWHSGFPTRAEAVARYAARTGFDVGALTWYRVFAAFKLAVILQQIYVRFLRGQTTDQRFAQFGSRVDALLRKADTLAGSIRL